MTAKVFPESNFIPPTANQNNKLLSNNGKNLFWTTPFDSSAFVRDGSISSTSVLELSGLPRNNTFELHFFSSTSMSTSTFTFNGDNGNNYTQNWNSTNGAGSTSDSGGTPTTLISSIGMSNAFALVNPVYYIRINGAGASGTKTAQIHWQSGNGNGLAMGTWRNLNPINRMNFTFGSTVTLTYRIVGY